MTFETWAIMRAAMMLRFPLVLAFATAYSLLLLAIGPPLSARDKKKQGYQSATRSAALPGAPFAGAARSVAAERGRLSGDSDHPTILSAQFKGDSAEWAGECVLMETG
ncbi:MAG: hypothetical protein HY013_16770 [Candidatus Solibacter usitatus]|nr:hypothetical protein [Candidatus Solibacter usitatus]